MPVFVILALTFAVLATALAVVAAFQLVGTVRHTVERLHGLGEQLRPAVTDIQRELEVTSTELEALEGRMSEGRPRQG